MRKLILLSVIALFIFSCAPKPKVERAKLPQGTRQPSTGEAQATSPQRIASNDLVEQGEAALKQDDLDRATDLFQECVSVDPTNGVGYYYLAWIKLQEGELQESQGYLDKAEVLLKQDPEWERKLEELKRDLAGQKE